MRCATLALLLVAAACALLLANAEVSSSLQRLRLRVEGQAAKVCRSRTTGEVVECDDNLVPIRPDTEDTPAAEPAAPIAEPPSNPFLPQKPLDELKAVHVPEPGVFPLQPGRPAYESGRVWTKEDAGRIAIVAALQNEYELQMKKVAEAETLGYTFKHAGEAPEKGTEPLKKGRKRNQMPEPKQPNNLEPNYFAQLTGNKPRAIKKRAPKATAAATTTKPATVEPLVSSNDIVV